MSEKEVKLVIKPQGELEKDLVELLTWCEKRGYVYGKVRSVNNNQVVCITIPGYKRYSD